jgi:protease-4
MWRDIELAKKVKPIIASMSDYAASGGYYMAMGTDAIVAQPTTVTGSIGIFAQWLNLGEDPSIWFSFVISMALLSLILSKG